jgi:hypothetical protein
VDDSLECQPPRDIGDRVRPDGLEEDSERVDCQ